MRFTLLKMSIVYSVNADLCSMNRQVHTQVRACILRAEEPKIVEKIPHGGTGMVLFIAPN